MAGETGTAKSSWPAWLGEVLRSGGGRALDFVLPPQCLVCRGRVSEHPGLCASCWTQIEFVRQPLCDRTGQPFAYDPGPGIVSAAALAKPPPWHRARAAAAFGPGSRSLVHALKYRDRHDAAALMARLMAHAGADLLGEADMIVPVPLFRLRLWQRRFNQAALLGTAIAKLSGVPMGVDVLRRQRATRSQVGLSNKDRRRNVRGAFALDNQGHEVLAGARVVLIDDVITTGATVGACASALLGGGAARVDVLAFALVCGPARVDA
jgi:ComF family protein